MDALKAWAVALALLMATPAQADSVLQWRPYVAEASNQFGIPVKWIERVMRAESGGMTKLKGRPIVSRAGAMGLMQLMPGTWSALRARLQLGSDPHDPHDNIIAGTAYLRGMYDRFGYPGLFAAYNAGPGRYAAYLAGARTLPGETQSYLATITNGHLPPDPRPDQAVNPIFFALRGNQAPAATSLFVTLGSGKKN